MLDTRHGPNQQKCHKHEHHQHLRSLAIVFLSLVNPTQHKIQNPNPKFKTNFKWKLNRVTNQTKCSEFIVTQSIEFCITYTNQEILEANNTTDNQFDLSLSKMKEKERIIVTSKKKSESISSLDVTNVIAFKKLWPHFFCWIR